MINRGGESISATEIEKLISQHPKVSTVAVVPMSDVKMGEKACAYIQLIDGNQLTFEDIISFLKEKNASVLQLPERIEFIKEMPYTGVGKLNKNKLREDIEKKIKEENSVTA
jgi:non-ribosomal peptide synthetase component E (peptide arylation enzyme)